MDDPESFIGRKVVQHDLSDERRFARLAATLDHDTFSRSAAAVPPLGHWLCFLPNERQGLIGLDGHPIRTKDGLLPDVGLPRRMWAGSRIKFLRDLPLNAPIERTSTLTAATPKSGRSGKMLFVTVEHRVSITGEDVAIVEEQDIVYREAAAPGSSFVRTAADPGDSDPTISIVMPDPVLLFRYSALTFNAHRIHYDRQYAINEEGYPGLVVQGPLIATLMLDHLLQHSTSRVESYSFRAASPSFAGEPIALGLRTVGNEVQLRAVGSVGVLMTGTAELKR
jgi:3-methylfumaryl-CoA hydratase